MSSDIKIFIYSWEVLDLNSRFQVEAYALDENSKPLTLTITDYYPYCYLDDLSTSSIDYTCDISGILPIEIKKELKISTLDITSKRMYTKVSFSTYQDMKTFTRFVKRNKHYMDDVDPITGFLSNNNFSYTGWYSLDENSTHQTKISVGKLKFIPGMTKVTHPKIACIDIETLSSSGYGMPKPYKREDTIEMVSVVFKRYLLDELTKYLVYVGDEKLEKKSNKDITYVPCKDEIELIHEMGRIIKEESPDVITGYNIFGFDLGYIISRLKLRLMPLPNMARTKKGITTTYKVNWSSSAYGQNVYDRVQISGRIFVDMMLFFKRMKLDKYSLDYVSNKFLGYGKKDITPEIMWKYFGNRNRKGLRKVAEYCIHDSVLTLELFDKFYLWTDVCEMSTAMKCSIEDIYTRGEQLKVLNQIIFKCVERNLVLTQRNETTEEVIKYEGAYVLEPKKGIFNGCTVVDFQSLYPSILIAYNICPSTYTTDKYVTNINTIDVKNIAGGKKHMFRKEPVGILPDLVKNLLSERFMVKNQIKNLESSDELTKIVLDRRQNALKICANSVYGITGFVGNKYMGHIPTAESITSTGRRLLNSVVDKIGDNFPVEVVYGDTDSCMIHHVGSTNKEANMKMAEKIVEFINRDLPFPLKLLVEKYYKKMAFLTKKRYIMFDGADITSKGVASARRNYCNYARKLYSDTMKIIFEKNSKNKVIDFVTESIYNLISGNISIEDLIMTKAIKSLDSYKNNNVPHVYMARRLMEGGDNVELGSRLEYIFVKVPNCKLQGERMFTPEEVRKWSLEIDYAYYIEKQLVTTIDELLELVGHRNYLKELLMDIKTAQLTTSF